MQLQRTTLRIKKPLYKRIKNQAVEKDKTVQQLINDALELYLQQPLPKKKIVFKDGNLGYRLKRPLTRKDLY